MRFIEYFKLSKIEYITSLIYIVGMTLGALMAALYGIYNAMTVICIAFLVNTLAWRGRK